MPMHSYTDVLFDEPMIEFVARNHWWAVKIRDHAPQFDPRIVEEYRHRFGPDHDIRQVECGPDGIPCWVFLRWVVPAHQPVWYRWRKQLVNSGFAAWPAFSGDDQCWEVENVKPMGYADIYAMVDKRVRWLPAKELAEKQRAERERAKARHDRAFGTFLENMDSSKAKGYVGHHLRQYKKRKKAH